MDPRDESVARSYYLNRLFDFEGTDLKRVYEPISNQIGYVVCFFLFLMLAHFAYKRIRQWRDDKLQKCIPYKIIKPPSSMVVDQQASSEEGDKKKKKRVCAVTGGTGFIGSHVVDELIKTGEYYVFVLGRKFRPERTNPDADCLIQVDLLDIEGLTSAFQGVDSVINTAAFIPNVFHSADEIYSKNRYIFRNLIVASQKAGVKHLVHVSGFPMATKFKDPVGVAFINSFYSSEKDIITANGKEGLLTSIISPTNIVGYNSGLFHDVITGKMTSFPLTDKMPTSFMPVEYLASALINAERKLASPSTTEEVAGKIFKLRGEPMSWKKLFTLPEWPHKVSDMSQFIFGMVIKVNVWCATLFCRAPFGADLTPFIGELSNIVEEEMPEEEVQEVYKVLDIGPPHPAMAEYVKQLVEQHKAAASEDKKET